MLKFAAVALLAFAGSACVKITNQSPDVELIFDTEISKPTKAIMTTTEYTDEGFYVSAYRNDTQLYFEGAKAEKVENEWKATNFLCFWPLSGKLDFTAFSPISAATSASVDNLRISGNGRIQANSYSITTTEDMGRDFCYATASRLDCSTDKSVVDLVFHHALSFINVKVSTADTDLSAGTADGMSSDVKISIDKVEMQGIMSKAVFLYDAATATTDHWSSHSEPMTYNVTAPTGETSVGFLMIPQRLSADAAIKISYTITQTVKNNGTEVRTIVTKHEGIAKIGENTPVWQENRKIVYDLVISPLHPIEFTVQYGQAWEIVNDYIFQF